MKSLIFRLDLGESICVISWSSTFVASLQWKQSNLVPRLLLDILWNSVYLFHPNDFYTNTAIDALFYLVVCLPLYSSLVLDNFFQILSYPVKTYPYFFKK